VDRTGSSTETESERLDRNFGDLLQELRVAQTGVQILFAFLLTLPFGARFGGVDSLGRTVYVIALLAATAAAGMIIAPVAYHRMMFRQGRKAELVGSAHRMATGGLAFLALSMVGSVFVVTDFVLNRTVAVGLTMVSAVWLILLWAVLPWLRRRSGEASDQ
jgi:hypothetical protein